MPGHIIANSRFHRLCSITNIPLSITFVFITVICWSHHRSVPSRKFVQNYYTLNGYSTVKSPLIHGSISSGPSPFVDTLLYHLNSMTPSPLLPSPVLPSPLFDGPSPLIHGYNTSVPSRSFAGRITINSRFHHLRSITDI
jgi:hypothetical protein